VPVEHVGAMSVKRSCVIIVVAIVINAVAVVINAVAISIIAIIVSVIGTGVVGWLKLAAQLLVIAWARVSNQSETIIVDH